MPLCTRLLAAVLNSLVETKECQTFSGLGDFAFSPEDSQIIAEYLASKVLTNPVDLPSIDQLIRITLPSVQIDIRTVDRRVFSLAAVLAAVQTDIDYAVSRFSRGPNWQKKDYWDHLLGVTPKSYRLTDLPVTRPTRVFLYRWFGSGVWTVKGDDRKVRDKLFDVEVKASSG